MHVYHEYSYCFSCGFRALTKEVLSGKEIEILYKEPENIQETLQYIKTLPTRMERGLRFHYQESGFYVLWPDESYYKLRLRKLHTRYVGPRGRRAPLFKYQRGYKTLVVTEGEINAMSLNEVFKDSQITIASPGSANEYTRFIDIYLQYDTVFAIVDKDIPGVINGLKIKEELLKHKKNVQVIALEKDINQILQESGTEGVKAWAKENLGM